MGCGDLEPDVGQFPPIAIPLVLVPLQEDGAGLVIIEREGEVRKGRGFGATAVLLVLGLRGVGPINPDPVGDTTDQHFERVPVDDAGELGFFHVVRNLVEPKDRGTATAGKVGTGFTVVVGIERVVRLGVGLEDRLCPFPGIEVSTRGLVLRRGGDAAAEHQGTDDQHGERESSHDPILG
jgi:hypothetical protein